MQRSYIRSTVASIIYNNDPKNGLKIPENLENPENSIVEAAKENYYAFSQRIENVINRNRMAQRRNEQIYADHNFAIFDMDDNTHEEFSNFLNNFNNVVINIHQRFNHFLFGDINNDNGNFANREDTRRTENDLLLRR